MFEQALIFFQQSPYNFTLCIGILSLMVGSFLNVVVYRLPKMMHNDWYQECRQFLADEVKDIEQEAEK